MKIVVVIPTFNEKENIKILIQLLENKVFPRIKAHKMYILVVDDNSPDGTSKVVKKLMKNWENISLLTGFKTGLGAAYFRGMSHAVYKIKADVLISMDSDGQHDPLKIVQFLKKIDDGYDMVIGSRYITGGSIASEWKLYRKLISKSANLSIGFFLRERNVSEWTTSYRAVKSSVFIKEANKLKQHKNNTFLPVLLYEAIRDGFKIVEIPIHFAERKQGQSKIRLVNYCLTLQKYILHKRFSEFVASFKIIFS